MSITDRSVAKDVGTETRRLVAAETNVRTIWRRYGPWAVTILNLSTFFGTGGQGLSEPGPFTDDAQLVTAHGVLGIEESAVSL